jgi:hypothetical protein
LLRHGAKGCATIRRQNGWAKSNLFGKSFQLTQQRDTLGNPKFVLAVR